MKIVILSGGSGNDALIKGLEKFVNDDADLEVKVIVNAYDNGKSTGVCRAITDTLGVSDIRKNHSRMYEAKHKDNLDQNILEFYNKRYNFSDSGKDVKSQIFDLLDKWQMAEYKGYVKRFFENPKAKNFKFNDFSVSNIVYAEMYKEGIVSKQDYDKSLNALTVAQANKQAADENNKAVKAALEANKAQVKSQEAEIQRLQAEVNQAKINLSYTKIYAPEDGMISARTVEKGNYLQIAQPMFSLVPQRVWVVANFKEIQLTNMKKDQPVWIKVDTYPHKKFKGHVDSIQRSTGAKSSLFPPENAVGSYVKIVQRVPVKILFDEDLEGYNIVPGMSVVPKVKVK